MKKLPRLRIRGVFQRLLLGVTACTALGAGSLGAYLVYDSLQAPPHARSAAVDVRALAADQGVVYDRRPVTPVPTLRPTPSPSPTPSPTPAPAQPQGLWVPPPAPGIDAPFHLVIDRIGVNAPVIGEPVDDNGVPQVPHNSYQVAWFTYSPAPGNGGNSVFAAHVTWNGAAVFYNLSTLGAGDLVHIVYNDGTRLTYTVTDSFLVGENDPNALQVMMATPDDVVTLISCDGTFYANGVFGDYTSRRVIRASLTSKE
ncbi:MAG: class F sortase [Chloroflexota bacterium]